ncbi:MAG: hypothetical protein M0Z60_13175 [Nitrospiraceae bacterium]|nr:hypothetical protein [Nitrospiraceae bacterium]
MKKERLDIDRVAFIGRTYEEYEKIFGLDYRHLRKARILDCPAGAASFAAEAGRRGFDVVACDILYGLSRRALLSKGEKDIALINEKLGGVAHLYLWDYYRDRDGLISKRREALGRFAADFPRGRAAGRYVAASLPRLPFADGTFSLVLSCHFLFLYGDMLDIDFHKECLLELARVSSGDVLIFPLSGLDGDPYPHLGEVLRFLDVNGVEAGIRRAPFEFQRDANMMMRLRRKWSSEIKRRGR